MKTGNRITRTNKIQKKLKGMLSIFSEKEIKNMYGESVDALSSIRGYLNFATSELDNYFDNVTVNSTRINLY